MDNLTWKEQQELEAEVRKYNTYVEQYPGTLTETELDSLRQRRLFDVFRGEFQSVKLASRTQLPETSSFLLAPISTHKSLIAIVLSKTGVRESARYLRRNDAQSEFISLTAQVSQATGMQPIGIIIFADTAPPGHPPTTPVAIYIAGNSRHARAVIEDIVRVGGASSEEYVFLKPVAVGTVVITHCFLALDQPNGVDTPTLVPEANMASESLPSSADIPIQQPAVLRFGGELDGPIRVLVRPPGEPHFVDTPRQRTRYVAIQSANAKLRTLCGHLNSARDLGDLVSALAALMEKGLTEVDPDLFWIRLNSLRRRKEIDQYVRSATDSLTQPLPDKISGELSALVDLLNIFASAEPLLVELDQAKRDPSERDDHPGAVDAAHTIAKAAAEAPQVIDVEAASALRQLSADAIGRSPSATRARSKFVDSSENMTLALIWRAYMTVEKAEKVRVEETSVGRNLRKGALQAVGAAGVSAVAYGAAILIKTNEVAVRTLIEALGGSKMLHWIVDLIVKVVLFP